MERYARCLNAVEINSSFHRHHRVQTYVRWSSSVPSHFRFSVKVPRTLTHEAGLVQQPKVLDRFIEEVRGLGHNLGVLLVQLPPSLAFNERLVRSFFDSLRNRIDVNLACEPRHASWGSDPADRVLAQCEVARVAADPPPWHGAENPGGFEKLAYFRWHGQPRKYYSDYDEERLASLRQQMTKAGDRGSSTWIIFDNTVLGCALGNALTIGESTRMTADQ